MLSNKTETEDLESGLGVDAIIQKTIKSVLLDPPPHAVFKLELTIRDHRLIRLVTGTEISQLLGNPAN